MWLFCLVNCLTAIGLAVLVFVLIRKYAPKDKAVFAPLASLAIFVAVMLAWPVYQTYQENFDYYGYQGFADFWRTPLQYPYDMVIIDSFDTGHLSVWQNNSVLSNITRYTQYQQWVIGERLERNRNPNDMAEINWFIFDCQTGQATIFTDEQSYLTALQQHGIPQELPLFTIRENWEVYWENY